MRDRMLESCDDMESLRPAESTPDLLAAIAQIEQRVGQLTTLEVDDEQEYERERAEQLQELSTRQEDLASRDREQAKLRDSIVRQQAEIDRLAADLREREKAIRSRESNVDDQSAELDALRKSLQDARKEQEKQQAEAKALAQAQQREQKRLAEYKEFLAQREKEIELQAEQHRKLRRELTEVANKLAQAEKEKAADAARSKEEQEANERRIKELESRCASFEESCRLLKAKRKELAKAQVPAPLPLSGGQPSHAVSVHKQQAGVGLSSVPGLVVLMTTVGALAVSAWLWLYASQPAAAVWVAGASYLVPLLGCATIKRRGVDFGLMLVAMFAGLLGAWFEPWHGVVTSALELWQLPLEALPAELAPQLSLTGTVLTATLAMSIATGLATGSFEILFRGIFVSIATSAVLLLPGSGIEIVVGAMAMWVLLHTMMLVKWSMPEVPSIFTPRAETSSMRPASL